jgi:chromosome segregation ATPase
MAERVTKYFEDKLNMIDAIIEKLRLKNSSLKGQINKIETVLSQKEEVGDALHYIDFHQLQIENKQYVAKIEERNEELLTVKVATGKTVQSLNEFKRKLNEKLEEADWLKKEVEDKKANLARLAKELGRVKTEVKSESRQKDTIRQEIEEAAEMPSIESYISQKREMYDLETSLKNWEKKVEIMEMAAKRSKVLVNKAKTYV